MLVPKCYLNTRIGKSNQKIDQTFRSNKPAFPLQRPKLADGDCSFYLSGLQELVLITFLGTKIGNFLQISPLAPKPTADAMTVRGSKIKLIQTWQCLFHFILFGNQPSAASK
jgi:hypothetical protein